MLLLYIPLNVSAVHHLNGLGGVIPTGFRDEVKICTLDGVRLHQA